MKLENLTWSTLHQDWFRVSFLGTPFAELFRGLKQWWIFTGTKYYRFNDLRTAENALCIVAGKVFKV